MFYDSSYILSSIRAGISNSSNKISDLYPVGIINRNWKVCCWEASASSTWKQGSSKSHSVPVVHKQRKDSLEMRKEILAEHVQTDGFFPRRVIFSNLINVSKKQNKHWGSADLNVEDHISNCINRMKKSFSKGCCWYLVHLKYSYCCNMSSMYKVQKDASSIFCCPTQIVDKGSTLLLEEFSFSSP